MEDRREVMADYRLVVMADQLVVTAVVRVEAMEEVLEVTVAVLEELVTACKCPSVRAMEDQAVDMDKVVDNHT